MPTMNPAPTTELPSSRGLLRSTLIAAAVATVLLVTVVLPAEYGVDPTRVGSLIGLTEMGEIKMDLAREVAVADSVEAAALQSATTAAPTSAAPVAAPPEATASPAAQTASTDSAASSHVSEFVLQPNEGREIKLVMRKDARVAYSWAANGGVVNYDTHADGPGISYHGYAKGTGRQSDEGVLVAAFDGSHGWFWRNRGRDAVTVTLRTSGDYQELKGM